MNTKTSSRGIQDKMAGWLDLPKDIVLNLPKISMIGNMQLYIENHHGLIELGAEKVRISVSTGEVVINGDGLTVRAITRDEIYLDGNIQSIRYNR